MLLTSSFETYFDWKISMHLHISWYTCSFLYNSFSPFHKHNTLHHGDLWYDSHTGEPYIYTYIHKKIHPRGLLYTYSSLIWTAVIIRLVGIFGRCSSIYLINAHDILRLPLSPHPYICCRNGPIIWISKRHALLIIIRFFPVANLKNT